MNEASADSTPPFVRTQTANREQQIAKRPYALQASSNLPLGGSYVKESTPNDQNRSIVVRRLSTGTRDAA